MFVTDKGTSAVASVGVGTKGSNNNYTFNKNKRIMATIRRSNGFHAKNSMKVITIMKDEHLCKMYWEKDNPHKKCLLFARYKVFVQTKDGAIYVLSALDDTDLANTDWTNEDYDFFRPLDVPITLSELEYYVDNEIAYNKEIECDDDEEEARSYVYDLLKEMIADPMVTEDVRDFLKDK